MAILSNPKHERFAQLLAAGAKTQAAAYELAGYQGDSGNASRMTADDRIRSRIAEIQAKAAEHAVLSREAILDRMLAIALRAERDGKWSSAINATEKLGREIHGMFKERAPVD